MELISFLQQDLNDILDTYNYSLYQQDNHYKLFGYNSLTQTHFLEKTFSSLELAEDYVLREIAT